MSNIQEICFDKKLGLGIKFKPYKTYPMCSECGRGLDLECECCKEALEEKCKLCQFNEGEWVKFEWYFYKGFNYKDYEKFKNSEVFK